jgi:hypothetical protein
MAIKADFTTQEWSEVLGSVMLAAMAVTLADPSGLIGMTKEGFASGSALLKAKTDPNANELIKAVASDFGTSEGRTAARGLIKSKLGGRPASDMKAIILETLRQTSALLDAKSPGDAGGFKAWLRGISESVANAAREGGFMGFGGVRVSDAEKATLDEVSMALNLTA